MARRLKSLLPGSAVDGHGGGLGSLRQAGDQSVKQDLPADDEEETPDGAAGQGAAADGIQVGLIADITVSPGFTRHLAASSGVDVGNGVSGGNGISGDDHGSGDGVTPAGVHRVGRAGSHAARDGESAQAGGDTAAAGGGGEADSAGELPEAAPTAVLDRPARERRRRWLPGQLRDVPAANPLCDLSLLVRVRDRLKELPDRQLPEAQPGQAEAVGTDGVGTDTDAGSGTGSGGESDGDGDGDQAITAIRDTFAIVAAAGDMAPAYFYGWLFANHPELRELFPPAMDEQRDRLFSALTQIVQSLRTPEQMAVYLAQLGRDHRKYSVKPEMYGAVGSALIATLRAFAGSAFTQAAEDAWVSTYNVGSDIMIKAAEEAGANTPAFWHAEVVNHERRGHDLAIVTVAPEERFNYRAGQHVTVQTSRWPRVWRPYSIACRQREDGLLRFHVKAVSGGWVSSTLVGNTSVGDPLILGPAVGNMTLARAERRDLVCVAGGTGLAPIKAIAEQVVYEEATQRNHRNIWLFWGTRTEKDMYDLRDLWRLTDIYPWLQVHPVASDDPAYPGMQGSVGRVAARYLPHGDCEAYVAGPAAMVQETIRMLTKAGIPIDRVHYDDGMIGGRKRVGTGT
jgi:NAD(P)H-flavin reductase